jgi:probable phosphoglycerate mutase
VAIVSSDLGRARQTAEPMASALGLPVQLDPALRERNFGAFEGLDRDEVQIRFPEQFEPWQSRDPRFAPPQGESLEVFSERVLSAVGRIMAAYPGECVVCVTHGGVLDCVYRWVTGLGLDAPRDHALLNASVNVVELGAQGGAIVKWADIGHLSVEATDDAGTGAVDDMASNAAAVPLPSGGMAAPGTPAGA